MNNDTMKKITAVFLSAVFVFILTACSGGGNENDTEAADTSVSEENKSEDNTNAEINSGDGQKSDAITELESKYTGLSSDELKWEYNSSTKTLTISGEGPMKVYSEDPEWFKHCDEAEKIVICDGVTSVSNGAFMWFSVLSEVKLGNTVEFIDGSAFCDCYSLYTVNFPDSLKYVGKKAFQNALLHSENGFVLPEGMLYIGENGFYSAFKENTVKIPASLSVIEDGAFDNCFVKGFAVDENNPAYTSIDGILYDKNITKLINYPADKQDVIYEIPVSVTKIREQAIQVTNNLEKIVIPASVTSIDEEAIYWNYALTYIEVDSSNPNYISKDGVLFTKDGKTLLSYPIASDRTEYTIPEGTQRIGNFAMSQAKKLTELHTCDGLEEIGEYALYYCENLKTLGLPLTLTTIENRALQYCNSLSEINYAGKDTDWKKVSIGEENGLLTDGTIQIKCEG